MSERHFKTLIKNLEGGEGGEGGGGNIDIKKQGKYHFSDQNETPKPSFTTGNVNPKIENCNSSCSHLVPTPSAKGRG